MSAELSPGIKSLHLSLDTPVDAITGKVRNDLSAVKVWYSSVPGFNPNDSEGSLAFNGLSLDITISNLLPNTQYYVRYAFISAIDPTVFTLSAEESELTYDEAVTVYGNLTNPSSVIPTNADGTNGNYTPAGGTFKVYSYSTEVTGTGVTYAKVADTTVGGLDASINPTTGVYTVSGLTGNYGSVLFSATYDGVTVFTTLVVTKARAGIDGTNAQLLKILAEGNSFLFKDTSASVADTQQLTFSAKLQNLTATVEWTAEAFDVNRVSLGPVAFTSNTATNSITISNNQFNPAAYNNAVAYVAVIASYNLLSDTVTVYRINNGTEQITVEFSNEAHTIPANYDGTTEPAGYVGSGTIIRVKEGNNYLPVDYSSPYADGTWVVTSAAGTNITPDPTPGVFTSSVEYDTHSNMTSNTAYIDYTIQGKTSTGKAFNITRRQSFAKSVGGVPGFSASLVTLTTTELVFIKFKDGTHSSDSVTIFSTIQNITNPVYTWTVDGVVQAGATLQEFEFARPATVGAYTIGVTVTSSSDPGVNAQDTMSIAYIEEGSDAYTFLFKDPQIVLSANNLGIVENGITQVTNHIIGARGIALLVPGTDIVYTVDSTTNCTANITTVTGTWNQQFTITGSIYSDPSISNATVVIKCQVPGGPSFLQTCYIAKVKTGATGAAGAAAIAVDLVSEADVVTTAADGTGYTLPGANTIRLYSGGALVSSGVVFGGTATKNGLTATVNSSTGAITLSGASWTSNSETFAITATFGGVTYTSNYTIAKSRAGSDAVVVDLLSEAEVVVATSTGTGYTLPTGNSMRVFKGGVQVTSGVVYGGGTTKNGLTLAIDASTGAITLSGASWTTDKETFVLTATYASVAYTYTYKISKAKQGTAGTNGTNGTNGINGTNGTNGTNAPKTTSGYIYYAISGGDPGTPSASSFNFSTGAFTGLSANWGTSITMTGNGTYWASRYVVTESSAGSNTGTPAFSVAFTHQNFSGLITFTDQTNALSSYATQTYASNVATNAASNAVSNRPTYFEIATQGYTTIHGGNISTGTISVDRIVAGTAATQSSLTFGFGIGSAISGISTAGWFKSNTSSATGLAAYANYSPAVAAVTSSVSNAAALFSNTYGNYDSISAFHVVVGASIAHGDVQQGFFTQRRSPNVTNASETNPNNGTSAYAKIAYIDPNGGGFAWGAKIMTTNPNGTDLRGITIGGTGTYGATALGGFAPFTGCHDGLLDKTTAVMPGDILVDTGIVIAKLGVGDTLTQVMVSYTANQKSPIGIYVDKNTEIPHILKTPVTRETVENGVTVEVLSYELGSEYEDIIETHDIVAINSLGEGQINVCGENGTIELGDLIVTSSIPGKGMRQADDIVRSYTVAKARETVTFDSPTQVKQISCIYLCG